MNIFIHFPNGVDQKSMDELVGIQGRGNVVTYEKFQRVTPSQFAAENAMHPGSVSRLLHHPDCPELEGRISGSGRVIEFVLTDEVRNFLLRGKTPRSAIRTSHSAIPAAR